MLRFDIVNTTIIDNRGTARSFMENLNNVLTIFSVTVIGCIDFFSFIFPSAFLVAKLYSSYDVTITIRRCLKSVSLFGWFLNVLVNNQAISRTGPKTDV